MVIVGGEIPKQDYRYLFDAGTVAIFGPGTKISDTAITVLEILDVCNRIPRSVTRELEADGYEVVRWPGSYEFARVHAIAVGPSGLSGAADPGGDGMALTP